MPSDKQPEIHLPIAGRPAMPAVDGLMRAAVADGVFPGGVLLVSLEGRVRFFEAYGLANLKTRMPASRQTLYDLASLTKPLATALAVMELVASRRLSLNRCLGELLPPFRNGDKSELTLRHLLHHTSGLPAHRPYFRVAMQLPARRRRTEIRERLRREPLVHPPGVQVLYSDLGFMLLQWVVETVGGCRLDHFVSRRIYFPLGLQRLFFIDLEAPRCHPREGFAATEQCPWRGRLLSGEVHDDNAFVMGGVAGHAGLFGTAADVHRLLTALLSCYRGETSAPVFAGEVVRQFFTRLVETDKALGFDMPAAVNSSCGSLFSRNSVGHLGFTGTSFWMDLDRGAIVILLTNRVHPSRANEAIRAFRPVLHDEVFSAL
jgi:CubicO group peptidase (beta-lactamase class C family)